MIGTVHWLPMSRPPAPPGPTGLHLWRMDLGPEGAEYSDNLSPEERARAARYFHPADMRRYALARGGMRHILGSYLGIQGDAIEIRYGAMGKPYINGMEGSGLAFNLSHCGDTALLAVVEIGSVGVDLEGIRPRANVRQIARRVFTPDVCEEIESLPDNRYTDAFFTHWTALEARVKCQGKGVFSDLDPRVNVVNFCPGTGLVGAIAMPVEIPPMTLWEKFLLSG